MAKPSVLEESEPQKSEYSVEFLVLEGMGEEWSQEKLFFIQTFWMCHPGFGGLV